MESRIPQLGKQPLLEREQRDADRGDQERGFQPACGCVVA